ncbi:MAG: universal stress protein [Candidatus Sumerlaeia bacterium]
MFKTILLATDGSPYAQGAMLYTGWFAERLGANVKILFVQDRRLLEGPLRMSYQILPGGIPGGTPSTRFIEDLRAELQRTGDSVLAETKTRLEKRAGDIKTVNEAGIVDETILTHSRTCDIVVMGAKGQHSEFTRTTLGSTTDRVIRRTVAPVLVCPDSFKPVERAMVAYDQSVAANKALHIACDLAHQMGLELIIINVVEKGELNESSQLLAEAADLASSHEIKFSTIAREGPPEEQILEAMEQQGAQLLMMGLRARRRIVELFLGSTATHILNKAMYPVLVVS